MIIGEQTGSDSEIRDPMVVENAKDMEVNCDIVQLRRQVQEQRPIQKAGRVTGRDDDRILAREEGQGGDNIGVDVGPAQVVAAKRWQVVRVEIDALEEAISGAWRCERLAQARLVGSGIKRNTGRELSGFRWHRTVEVDGILRDSGCSCRCSRW